MGDIRNVYGNQPASVVCEGSGAAELYAGGGGIVLQPTGSDAAGAIARARGRRAAVRAAGPASDAHAGGGGALSVREPRAGAALRGADRGRGGAGWGGGARDARGRAGDH